MEGSMKFPVKRFKSLAMALKELEPYIRNGQHLLTGKPFKQLDDMRSREVLANWLICVVTNAMAGNENLTFCGDPLGGDGIIYDTATEEIWPTEHVMAARLAGGTDDIDKLVLKAIDQKRNKGGAAYASGKTLVVLLEGGMDVWYPNSVARQLPNPLYFETVWVVGLQAVDAGEYVYGVTNLDLTRGNAPTLCVRIRSDFDGWEVIRLQ
jgi:hypothetical protein